MMLNYSEITARKFIVLDGEPYEVLSSGVAKKQRQKPVNQTKLKSLISGKVTERSFHQSDTVEEADIDTKKIQYLYNNRGEYWFAQENNPRERFSLKEELVGVSGKFLKEKGLIDAVVFKKAIIGIKLPIKVDLRVIEAPPGTRGNTAQGGTKQVVLETGAIVAVPLFINAGDVVRVNTETNEYVERAQKR